MCFLVSLHTWEWHVLSVLRWEWVQSRRYGCRLAGRQRDVGCLHVAFILHGVTGKWAALITVGQKARARGSQEGSFTRICKRYFKVTMRRLWNALPWQGQAKDPESGSWLSNESGTPAWYFPQGTGWKALILMALDLRVGYLWMGIFWRALNNPLWVKQVSECRLLTWNGLSFSRLPLCFYVALLHVLFGLQVFFFFCGGGGRADASLTSSKVSEMKNVKLHKLPASIEKLSVLCLNGRERVELRLGSR